MSEVKHTSGPWKYSEADGAVISVGDCQQIICVPPGTGSRGPHGEYGPAEKDFHDKNARLIAAAPDLLSALEDLYKHCAMVHKIWGADCNQKQADKAIAIGRAAIAKAKGE